ncbi:MAG: phospho-sugar mutase [Alphaproteobacteria bacterium]|nr:phospho-sugar mutase [Alphaproteobacteria bacterium]MCB9697419.1 phospho-sugar mutase [Alphaproteobacteria bacterium]
MADAVLEQAAAGLDGVAVPAEVRAAALTNLTRWWTEAPYADWRGAIRGLVEAGRFEELCDAFRQVLPFGTGGRRGSVGVGPNRMNPWTVGTSVQGHAAWLRQRFEERTIEVVVAYDVRRFEDARGVYVGLDIPVRGLSSRDLAELAARVYAANGIVVHLLPRDSGAWMSTPELSFTIRSLGALGGLNLSASHNPPDDNGVKVYDEHGGQLCPPLDEELLSVVSGIEQARELSWEAAVATGLVRFLGPEHHQAYVAAVASVAPAGPREIRLLYTPLHGTGVVHEVLAAAGFECRLHEPQAVADGAFPTVPGGVANPENPKAMAHALAAAGDAELVFGTDPDADRIGCEVLHRGRFVHLTGNDIAALVVFAACGRPTGGRRPLVVQTEVTSAFVSRVAAAAGAVVVDDLLVGFKYVAEGLRLLEQEGAWGAVRADDVVYVAGCEESHGVLVTDRIRDKDAAGGAVLLAALAARERVAGRTLVDLLEELREAHGYVRNGQVTVQFEGATGQARMNHLLDDLRQRPPVDLGGRAVASFVDHRDESGRFGPFRSDSDRQARNVLVATLVGGACDDGARLILRPSGTEPKLKVYVEVQGRPHLDEEGRASVDATLAALEAAARHLAGT